MVKNQTPSTGDYRRESQSHMWFYIFLHVEAVFEHVETMFPKKFKPPAIELLERLVQWDALDIVGSDGPFWKAQIQTVLERSLVVN
jgi:hypothetical protein